MACLVRSSQAPEGSPVRYFSRMRAAWISRARSGLMACWPRLFQLRRLEVFFFLPDLDFADFEPWVEDFEVAFFCPLEGLVVVAAEAAPTSSPSAVSAPTTVHIARFLKTPASGREKTSRRAPDRVRRRRA